MDSVITVRVRDQDTLEYAVDGRIFYTSKVSAQWPMPLVAVVSFGHGDAQLSAITWLPDYDCSTAGNGDGDCAAIGREPCFQNNLCSDCLAGTVGTQGPTNADDCQVAHASSQDLVTWAKYRGVSVANGTLTSLIGGWGKS